MGTIPTKEEWAVAFAEACAEVHIKDDAAIAAEAERSFGYYNGNKVRWRDKSGSQIKFYPMVARYCAATFARRLEVGYVVKKQDLHIPDCCWRPQEECDCANLLYLPERNYEFPRDMLKAMQQMEPCELAAQKVHSRLRRTHTVPISANSEQYFRRSTATDLGRGRMEEFEGAFVPNAREYFARMAPWIEFCLLRNENWCHLAKEIDAAYMKWSRSGGRSCVLKPGEGAWGMITRIASTL